jgi:hypothetical protein
MVLRFSPSAAGSRTGLLTLADNAPGNPHTDPLNGVGVGGGVMTPQLTIVPGIGSPGSTATVTGSGWGPTVMVVWDVGLDGKKVLATPNGTFTTHLYIFRHDFLGPRNVVASDGKNRLTQPFLAVPGTSGPPGFLLRR